MEEELNPSVTIPSGDDVAPVEGVENDSQTVGLKDILREATGREYPDDEAAYKSLTETYSYVGKLGQKVKSLEQKLQSAEVPVENQASAVSPDVLSKVEALEAQLRETQFYANHPEYNNEDAKTLIKAMGNNPETVVENEAFKKAFSAIQANAEIEKSKSVLVSNPRLGQVTDKMTQAKEALAQGNHSAAADAAVQAVMDAYDIK